MFGRAGVVRYADALFVTDAAAVTAYASSLPLGLTAEEYRLFEETGMGERRLIRCTVHPAEGGRRVAFVVFLSNSTEPPRRTNARRRQTFRWFASDEIPLLDFHAADRQFITRELPALVRRASGCRPLARRCGGPGYPPR